VEDDVGDVFGVSTVRLRQTSLDARISEDPHQGEVVTGAEEVAIGRSSNSVDVSAILTLGVDTVDVPRELDGLGGPCDSLGVGFAGGILLAVGDGEVEELVGAAVGSDPLSIG
jgi:hypothetical protein